MNKKTLFMVNPFYLFSNHQDAHFGYDHQFENGRHISKKSIRILEDLRLSVEVYDLETLSIDIIEEDPTQDIEIIYTLNEKNNFRIYEKSKKWKALHEITRHYIHLVQLVMRNNPLAGCMRLCLKDVDD